MRLPEPGEEIDIAVYYEAQPPGKGYPHEAQELIEELEGNEKVGHVNRDSYCPTPGQMPIFGEMVEIAIATGTSISFGVLANLLYDHIKHSEGVSVLAIGDKGIVISDDMEEDELKQKITEAWEDLED